MQIGIGIDPEGFVYPDSRCNSVILVNQSTESIDADDHTVSTLDGAGLRRLERETTVWSFLVVVPEIRFENPLQMSLAEDQEAVQALASHRLHEASCNPPPQAGHNSLGRRSTQNRRPQSSQRWAP